MTVEWVKCDGGVSCGMETVEPGDVTTSGVYVIRQDPLRRVICVGDG